MRFQLAPLAILARQLEAVARRRLERLAQGDQSRRNGLHHRASGYRRLPL